MNIASIIMHYIVIICIFYNSYLFMDLLEILFMKVEEKDEKAKPRKNKSKSKMAILENQEKYYTFVLTFVHKIITIVLAITILTIFTIFLIIRKKELLIYIM